MAELDKEEVELTKNYVPTMYERETVITYNDQDKTADVCTMNKTLIRKLDALLRERDDITCVRSESINGVDNRMYIVPKKWIKVSPPKKINMTDEQRKLISERLHRSQNKADSAKEYNAETD